MNFLVLVKLSESWSSKSVLSEIMTMVGAEKSMERIKRRVK